MEKNQNTFVGKTKVVTTKYGEIVKIAFGPKDWELLQNAKNDSGWVNLELKGKRDGGKFLQVQSDLPKKPVNSGDDLPF